MKRKLRRKTARLDRTDMKLREEGLYWVIGRWILIFPGREEAQICREGRGNHLSYPNSRISLLKHVRTF